MNSKVLLLSVIPSDFSKLFELAQLLKKYGIISEFYFDERAHAQTKNIEIAQNADFFCHSSGRKKIYKLNKSGNTDKKKHPPFPKPLIFAKRFFSELKFSRKKIKSFKKLLLDRHFSLLITSLNMRGYNLPLYKKAADSLKIKIISVPFAIGDKDALGKSIFAQKKTYPDYLYNKLVGRFFKKWEVDTARGKHLILPAEMLLVYFLLRVKVKIPQSFYGLEVDKLLLENKYMLKHANKQGIGAKSYEITGGVFDDQIFKNYNDGKKLYENLGKEFNFQNERKIILIALPPLVGEFYRNGEYLDEKYLLELFLPSTINFDNYNILISPHPRINIDNLKSIELPANFIIIDKPVELLIPMCDLFVTTFSSTIRMAAALNKIILNYDILSYQYELFSDIKNMTTVTNENEYLNHLPGSIMQAKSEYL